MRKNIILLTFVLCSMWAIGQHTYYVYIPGDGERQMGLMVGPSVGSQVLTAQAYGVKLPIESNIGFGAGAFYGYETDHGTFIEFGNHTSLMYHLCPFVGDLVGNKSDGTPFNHHFSSASQIVQLYENPFLAYRVSPEFIINAGVGLGFSLALPSGYKIDGQSMGKSVFGSIFAINSTIDANVGVRYYFTDDLFVAAHAHYNFYALDFTSFGESNSSAAKSAGAFKIDESGSNLVYSSYIRPFWLVLSFGKKW